MNILLQLLLAFLSILLFLLLFLPLLIYRWIVILLSKFTLPHGSSIIAPQSAMFCPHFSSVSPLGGIIATIIFADGLDHSKISATVSSQVQKHPRLRSVPILYWMYTFWTPVEKFILENHVISLVFRDGKFVPVSEIAPSATCPYSDLLQKRKTLLSAPFPPGQSPWLIYIVKGVTHPVHGVVDVLLFKWHHGLADGLSILKILSEAMEPSIELNLPSSPIPFFASVAMTTWAVAGLLEDVLSGSSSFCESVVSPSVQKLKKGESYFLSESDPVQIESIKAIKNRNKVAFGSVGLAALGRALKTFAEQKAIKNTEDASQIIPTSIPTSIILPYPGHPNDELVNHWTCANIPLPLNGDLTEISSLGKSCRSQSGVNFKRIGLFGRLPSLFHGFMLSPPSIVYSEVPGPTQRFKVWGTECLDMSFNIHIPPGQFAICISTLSYDGKWKIGFNVDAAVCSSQEEADSLGHLITKYIHEMDV